MTGILHYLKHPYYQKNQKIDWVDWVFLFIIYFGCALLLNLIIAVLSHVLLFENKNSSIRAKDILLVVGLAPLIEECLFRLLLKPKLKNLILFSVIVLPLLCYWITIENYLLFAILMPIEILVLVLLYNTKSYLFTIQRKFIKYFPWFFYFAMLSFGFLHLTNMIFKEFSFWIVLISPLLVAPQIVLGSILGFIRMRFGFLYSVLFHVIINGFVGFMLVLKMMK